MKSPAWLQRFADWPRVVLCLAVAVAGALVFLRFKLPLPYFLGSLTFCLIAAVTKLPLARPQALGVPSRIVLGVAIGAAFTPELFARAGGMAVSLAALLPWTLAIVAAGVLFFERVAGFDRQTAFFSAVPGGLAEMIAMANDTGANSRTVTLVQSVRILLIVFVLPLWLGIQASAGGAMGAGQLRLLDLGAIDAGVLLAVGIAGWLVARWLRLAGAAIVGPMLLSALVHVSGLTQARVPFEIMTLAQIVIGALLGAQFKGLTLRELAHTVSWGVAFSGGLIAVTIAMAAGIARLTGYPPGIMLMAFAPGGQVELNLLALLLGLDVAFIALHHLVRLAIVMGIAQIVLRRLRT